MTNILTNWTWLNLGILTICISGLGYFSHWLNSRYFRSPLMTGLYYLGAVIHELSHALMCLATGARIQKISFFSRQPKVVHEPSRLPLVGQILISLAPIGGGLLTLWLMNHYLLDDYIQIISLVNSNNFITWLDNFWQQLNITHWQTWLIILLSLNMGAMIGPSKKDLSHIWPALVLFFFITWPPAINLALLAIGLIVINLIVQLVWRLEQIVFKKITS